MPNTDKTLALLLVDSLILFVGLGISLLPWRAGMDLMGPLWAMTALAPIWLLMYFTEGLYTLKTHNPAEMPISLIRGTTFAAFISFGVMYFLPASLHDHIPGTRILVISLLVPYMIFEWRRFFFSFLSAANRRRRTVLIGSRETLDLAEQELQQKPYLGYNIIARFDPHEAPDCSIPNEVQLIAIERRIIQDQALYQKAFTLLGSGVEVTDLAKFTEKISGKIPLASIDPSWFVEYCGLQNTFSYDLLKGLIDRLIASLLLLALLPVAIILFPLLWIFHGTPIFFKQERMGLNNRPFTLFKLRTMVVDAEKNGAQWAKPGDARITLIGAFLRKTRLDELPQLINIFRGEMSLVGPRPERPEIITKTLGPQIPYYNLRHLVKPGVTGWAQVTFRYGFSTADSKEKLQFDLYYVKNRHFWLDLLIIIKTVKTVLTGAGQ